MDDTEKPSTLKTLAWAYEWALGIAVILLVLLTWGGVTA